MFINWVRLPILGCTCFE